MIIIIVSKQKTHDVIAFENCAMALLVLWLEKRCLTDVDLWFGGVEDYNDFIRNVSHNQCVQYIL